MTEPEDQSHHLGTLGSPSGGSSRNALEHLPANNHGGPQNGDRGRQREQNHQQRAENCEDVNRDKLWQMKGGRREVCPASAAGNKLLNYPNAARPHKSPDDPLSEDVNHNPLGNRPLQGTFNQVPEESLLVDSDQAQQTPFHQALACESAPWGVVSRSSKWKCFLYCNGLMDHIYVCRNGSSCTSWYKTPTHFSGTLDAFVKIIRHEGLRSLWSGLPPTLIMAVPATVIYFTCYDHLRDFLWFGLGLQGNHIPLLAGGLARLGAVTVISPLELVRTKMQSRKLSYSELRVCMRSAVGQGGLLSLWRGWGPTVLRDVPFSALYWFNYELVKIKLCEQYQTPQANFSISFTAGAVSGAIAAVLTLPFDVVKTHRQIQLGELDTVGVSVNRATSTWHIMKKIWMESGYRGLFAGFMPRVIKVAPACAVMISSYEFGKAFFQKMNLDRQQLAT